MFGIKRLTIARKKLEAGMLRMGGVQQMNRVRLVGRLTADPIFLKTRKGDAMTRFRMATNDRRAPEFHYVVAWRQQAQLMGRAHKGQTVLVDGWLHRRTYKLEDGTAQVVIHGAISALPWSLSRAPFVSPPGTRNGPR